MDVYNNAPLTPISREAMVRRLVEHGIAREPGGRVRWLFGTRGYPLIDGKKSLEAKRRIAAPLLGEVIPDPRGVVIIALARACGLLQRIFSEYECFWWGQRWPRSIGQFGGLAKPVPGSFHAAIVPRGPPCHPAASKTLPRQVRLPIQRARRAGGG